MPHHVEGEREPKGQADCADEDQRDLRGGGGSICLMILNEVFLVTRSCSKGFGLGCENPVPEPFRPRLLGEITQPQALL